VWLLPPSNPELQVTKIDFYTGVTDRLETACLLSHKALQNGMRVLLHTSDKVTAQSLDTMLWQYPPASFIPHCLSNVTEAAEMPVIIGHQPEPFPHSELLISLHNNCLPFFSRFERVIEIVSLDTEDARLGRERYSFYRERGFEMRHFDLSKK
jgi:DNA polymerase-3 subunit chi